MPGVTLKPSETLESAIRRYKRVCEKTRINAEMRRREFFEKPAEERKRRFAAAVKRCRKRLTHDSATSFSMNKKRKR